MKKTNKTKLNCSFCSKSERDVTHIITGEGMVCICDECIILCNEIIHERFVSTQKAYDKLLKIKPKRKNNN